MPFVRPTLPAIISRTFADLTSRLTLSGAVLRRSVVGVLSRVLAGASHMLHGHLDWVAREAIIYTAIDTIPQHAATWGLTPTSAVSATGTVDFTGTINGTVMPAGTALLRSDGEEFTTDAEATLSALALSVAVTAVNAGVDGNTDAGATLRVTEPISGITSTGTVDGDGLTSGTDIETNPALKVRLLERIQNPPHGGSEADYIRWAKEVSGVTRAFVYPAHLGLGTVGVTFLRDNDASPIPDAGEVTTVQTYINTVRPVTADVTVFAPTGVALDFEIELTPDTSAVRAAVEAELEDMLLRDAVPGGTIYLSRIREAVSIAAGETDNIVTDPAANVTHAAGEIATMGTITWV